MAALAGVRCSRLRAQEAAATTKASGRSRPERGAATKGSSQDAAAGAERMDTSVPREPSRLGASEASLPSAWVDLGGHERSLADAWDPGATTATIVSDDHSPIARTGTGSARLARPTVDASVAHVQL